jgi:hypothetical protein
MRTGPVITLTRPAPTIVRGWFQEWVMANMQVTMTSTNAARRMVRSATYHRLASAPLALPGARPRSLVRTRPSLLRRALRSLGWTG